MRRGNRRTPVTVTGVTFLFESVCDLELDDMVITQGMGPIFWFSDSYLCLHNNEVVARHIDPIVSVNSTRMLYWCKSTCFVVTAKSLHAHRNWNRYHGSRSEDKESDETADQMRACFSFNIVVNLLRFFASDPLNLSMDSIRKYKWTKSTQLTTPATSLVLGKVVDLFGWIVSHRVHLAVLNCLYYSMLCLP